MKFQWDNNKNEINVKKHKISFEEARKVFFDPFHLSMYDPDHSDNEKRWLTMGLCEGTLVVVVIHTYRTNDNEEHIRLISARKATSHERKQYFNQ